jgi:cytochrome c biogenesis protein CcdA
MILKSQQILRSFALLRISFMITISSVIAVFAAGLLVGFNPCLLAMLAFLASTILASSNRRRDIITMVAFFSLGTFAVYIYFWMGLFSFLQERSTAAIFRFYPGSHIDSLGSNAA